MSDAIEPIKMPKWGLSMAEGTIIDWFVGEGARVEPGDDLCDIETSKMTNTLEAPAGGTIRRLVGAEGDTLPVGALIGVMAPGTISDDDITAFVDRFNAEFVPEEAGGDDGLAGFDFTVGDLTLHLLKAGDEDSPAIPALLLHGFGGDAKGWAPTHEALAADRPVYALDLPGHGTSTKRVGDFDFMVEAVSLVIEGLETGAVHLVGHSMGGALALGVFQADPGRVQSFSLICPAGLPGTAINQDYLSGFIAARRRKDLKPFAEMLVANPDLIGREMLEELIKYKRIDGVSDCLTALQGMLIGLKLDPTGLDGTALVIASRQDRIVGAPDASALGSAKLEWLDEAGHMPQLEAAERVTALISEHLKAHD